MKKLLSICVLGLFLVGGVVGCGGSTTSATAPGTTVKEKTETKKVTEKVEEKAVAK